MKRLIKILSVVGVLVIALIVAGVAILKSMDFNDYRTVIAEQVRQATGRDLAIKGDLNLQISFSPSVAVDGVTFANAEWGSSPEMVSMDSFAAEVELMPLLSGDVQVKRIVLQGVDVLLETDADGVPNWEFPSEEDDDDTEGMGAGDEDEKLPVVHSVQIRDVNLSYRDGVTGETQNVTLAVLELNSDGAGKPMNLLLETIYNNEEISVSGTMGSIDTLRDNKIFPMKLDIAALGAEIAVDGTVGEPRRARGVNLGFTIISDDIASFAARAMAVAGVEGSAPLPAKPLNVSGALRDDKGTFIVDGLDLKIGGSDLAGSFSFHPGGKRPDITADLVSTLFDLADVTTEETGGGSESSASSDDGRVFPDDPLALDALKSVDAEIKFKGAQVNANGVTLGDVAAEVTLKNGRLVVSPFGLTFGGGRIGGDLTLDGSGALPKLSMAIDGKQVDYGLILKDMAGDESLKGKLDMTVQVRGAGASVRELMAGLDGKLRAQTQDGYVDSGALAFITGPLSALFEGEDAKTLRCAVVDFDITKGQATSKTIIFETGGLSIIGEGTIDLAQEKPVLRFDPRAKNTSFASVAEIGIVVGGTLKEPSVGPDVGDVALEAAGIAAGIATGGLTTIIGMAADTVSDVDETDYCALALAGKPLKPDQTSSSSSGSDAPAEPSSQSGDGQSGDSGIGGVIEGLFGN